MPLWWPLDVPSDCLVVGNQPLLLNTCASFYFQHLSLRAIYLQRQSSQTAIRPLVSSRCWLLPRLPPARDQPTNTFCSCQWFVICICSHLSVPFMRNWRSLFFNLAFRVAFSFSTLPFECSPTFVFLFVAHLDPSGLFNLSKSHSPRVFNVDQGHLKLSYDRREYCTITVLWHSCAGFWHLQDTSILLFQCFNNGFNSLQQLCIFLSSLFSIWLHLSLLAGSWCCLGVFDIGFCPGVGLSDVRFWVRWHFLVQP